MKAAIQERLNEARRQIAGGNLVFIRLASSRREYRVFAIGNTQHNIEAMLREDGASWMHFDPDDLVGIRIVEENNV